MGVPYAEQGGGGVSSREQRSRARSWRGGVSENWIAGSAAASLFFLIPIAIAIAARPFRFHANSVSYMSSSFVSSIHSLALTQDLLTYNSPIYLRTESTERE